MPPTDIGFRALSVARRLGQLAPATEQKAAELGDIPPKRVGNALAGEAKKADCKAALARRWGKAAGLVVRDGRAYPAGE